MNKTLVKDEIETKNEVSEASITQNHWEITITPFATDEALVALEKEYNALEEKHGINIDRYISKIHTNPPHLQVTKEFFQLMLNDPAIELVIENLSYCPKCKVQRNSPPKEIVITSATYPFIQCIACKTEMFKILHLSLDYILLRREYVECARCGNICQDFWQNYGEIRCKNCKR